jgi:hypothetical protein
MEREWSRSGSVPDRFDYRPDATVREPSVMTIAEMNKAAIASAHHQPTAVSRTRLARVAAARTEPARLRTPSSRRAALAAAQLVGALLAPAEGTNAEAADRMIPTEDLSGAASSERALIARAPKVERDADHR